jgi:outer membrane lipoprotein-sorting protein
MQTPKIAVTIVVVLTILCTGPAGAQEPAWILERVDSTLTAPEDIVATQRVVLIGAGGREKVRTLRVYQRGVDRRLAKFLTPADVRDVGYLRLADDEMYLYLPAFRRVRRIASSIKHEDFMGTDLSYEDLSRTRFGDDYRAVEVETTEQEYTLTLEPRPEADVSYGRIVMQVQRERWVITDLQLFGLDDRLLKTIVASDFRRVNDYWMAHRLEVRSVRDGHRTVLEFEELQVDTGLSDDFFSQRQLKRRG